jgi:ribosomal protein L13
MVQGLNMTNWVLGVIGGSGLYQIDGVEDGRWEEIVSPWGAPSDQVFRGRLAGIEIVFLPRHGRGHSLGPSQLNYRANIDVLKRAGCSDLLSLSAVGSLKEDYAPGDFVIVVNASKVKLTGRKLEQKKYYHHTGYPGGIKEQGYDVLLAEDPELPVRKAVWGMIPKGPLGRKIIKKLKVYGGPSHDHSAQQPKVLEVK